MSYTKEKATLAKELSAKGVRHLRVIVGRDEVRVPLQTTAAVLLAFVATLFMSRENMSWGVFSALFVVQVSVGGTVTSGIYRIVGAILGALIGVLAVLLPGAGDSAAFLHLAIGVTIMSAISYRWPKFAYGLVTVTVIIVSPGFYVVEGAMAKIVAIGIGSLCGIVAAVAMFPVSAHRRANYHLEQTLHGCSHLLEECARSLMEENYETGGSTIETISYHLSRAREITNHEYVGQMSIGAPLMFPKNMLREVEYFRDTLILLDRFSDAGFLKLSMQKGRRNCEKMQKFSEVACAQVDSLAIAMGTRELCEIDSTLQPSFECFCEAINDLLETDKLEQREREYLIAIKLVWGRMYENLTSLCEIVNEKAQRN